MAVLERRCPVFFEHVLLSRAHQRLRVSLVPALNPHHMICMLQTTHGRARAHSEFELCSLSVHTAVGFNSIRLRMCGFLRPASPIVISLGSATGKISYCKQHCLKTI